MVYWILRKTEKKFQQLQKQESLSTDRSPSITDSPRTRVPSVTRGPASESAHLHVTVLLADAIVGGASQIREANVG